MSTMLRRAAKLLLPGPAKQAASAWYGRIKMERARKAFAAAETADGFLPPAELESLMKDGHRAPEVIRYDPEGLTLRAAEKAGQIAGRVDLQKINASLELGCMDGMVAAELAKRGLAAHALDLNNAAFDARAKSAGVRFITGNAEAMPVESASMDLVYSFAAFEHFERPDRVIEESYRVLKKGGHLFLLFGPVYTSPYGRHAYRQIPVPYCHYLFSEEDLHRYAASHALAHDWPYVNGWTVTQYRALWDHWRGRFNEHFYKEHPTGGVGAELIARYPGAFRKKVKHVEDLFVSAVELCWEKS